MIAQRRGTNGIFEVVIRGRLGRIAAAAQDAKRNYRDFSSADLKGDLTEPTVWLLRSKPSSASSL